MKDLTPFHRRGGNRMQSAGDNFYHMLEDFFSGSKFLDRDFLQGSFKVDVEETPEEYNISADLPGVKKEEISLGLEDGKLTISVDREENIEDEKKSYLHKERRVSSMSRTLYLDHADSEKTSAKLEDGVLRITVSKDKKVDQSKKISIE